MLFTSLDFLLFLLVVILVYYLIPVYRWQKLFLLLSSYYYYINWEPKFLAILLFDTSLIYIGGVAIKKMQGTLYAKKILISIIILILLPLLCYKYLDFLLGAFSDVSALCGFRLNIPYFHLLLPIGISFYTFQAISYIVDVYKGKVAAEYNLLDLSLFLGFFPQISAGPIGRAPLLLPQFKMRHSLDSEMFISGFKAILWGFFMKLVVGDRAGIYVDTVFSNYMHHSGISLSLATFMYTIQIYCDFAGYSLIAIGTAMVLGFQLQTNFERPYFALSVTDFWRRWHISLSTWFRDYVYIPLGGNRVGKWKGYCNILITFLVSGLWHGAAYNFIIWGSLHGCLQILGKMSKTLQEHVWESIHIVKNTPAYRFVNILITFILVSYAWMIFKVNSLKDIIGITKRYFAEGELYVHQTTFLFFAIGFLLLFVKDFKDEFYPEKHYFLFSKYRAVRYISTVALCVIILLFGVLGGGQFIYFQF